MRILLSCAVVIIGGCAIASPIQKYGESQSSFENPPDLISHEYPDSDLYRIYHRGGTSFDSVQKLRQVAEQRASSFATQRGKSFVVVGEQISRPPYIWQNFPAIEIVFALIDANTSSDNVPLRDRYADLERLRELLDDGTLTQDEFDIEKANILNH